MKPLPTQSHSKRIFSIRPDTDIDAAIITIILPMMLFHTIVINQSINQSIIIISRSCMRG